jgi:hypothetical protein
MKKANTKKYEYGTRKKQTRKNRSIEHEKSKREK